MGLHDYDSLLTDYSVDSVFNYKNKIPVIKQKSNEQGLFEEYDFDLWDSLILC
jgi:hypothetical protein